MTAKIDLEHTRFRSQVDCELNLKYELDKVFLEVSVLSLQIVVVLNNFLLHLFAYKIRLVRNAFKVWLRLGREIPN